MDRQLSLFDEPSPPAKLNSTVSAAAAQRLSKQQQAILDRLRQGPASNVELMPIAMRYSARICELRQAGYVIDKDGDERSGVFVYSLRKD